MGITLGGNSKCLRKMSFIIKHIFVYPVKSLGGLELGEAELCDTGLRYDRQYMIVDDDGKFLTQREHRELALLKCSLQQGGIVVRSNDPNGTDSLVLKNDEEVDIDVPVSIWGDNCHAAGCSAEADAFFSDYLKRRCRLVRLTDRTQRKVDSKYDRFGNITSFVDGYPLLLTGTASLHDLNSKLSDKGEKTIGWDRFRPSIVVSTEQPFEEDGWKNFMIGEFQFSGVKLCARCVVTTINQSDGTMTKEPLRTLASYRTIDNKVYFGQNVISHQNHGVIRIGQELTPITNEGF